MKILSTAAFSVVLLLAACRTAQTQSQPQVIVVPHDEMTRTPSVGEATSAPAPAQAQSSPEAAGYSSAPVHSSGKTSYSACYVDGPYIAMTFDDGPSAELTPKLLDALKQRGIKATFFMVGQCVAQNPDIVRRMVDEGHEVANHSWNHPALTKLGPDGVKRQLSDTSDMIFRACGVRPVVMRPPYGATNATLNKRINDEYGMKVVLWSVDPLDWKYRNADRVYNSITQAAQPGSIILAHDIHASTVAAMPRVFDTLLAKGYKFVTVSELIAMNRPELATKKQEPSMPSSAPVSTPVNN